MSLVHDIFGGKVRLEIKAIEQGTLEPKAPPKPPVKPRDLVSEAVKVERFKIDKDVEIAGSTLVAEELRSLRTNLLTMAVRDKLKSIVLSSCHHGEGKTTMAVNLAMFMAKSPHRKVLLLDGDMRRPKIKQFLSLEVKHGLEDVLLGKAEVGEALIHSQEDHLTVLPVRSGRSNAAEMLDLPAMDDLAALLLASFDYVVCDTTPLLSTTDPCVLASRLGAVGIVVRAGLTQRESVEHAKAILEQAGVRIAGLIINHVRFYIPRYLYRYQYYHDYHYRYEEEGAEGKE